MKNSITRTFKYTFTKTHRLIAVTATLTLFLTLMAFMAGCNNESNNSRIIVADARTTHHLNLYVAYELGFFTERGLDVEIIQVDDLSAARDLVVSGGADVFWTCPTVAIAAIANGAPLQTIAQVKAPCTSVLLVPEDSPIQTLADLDGKDIAGASPTCEAVISLDLAANEAGASFNLQNMSGGAAIAALQAGAIDGAILEEPQASIAELAGFKVLFREVAESVPCRTINASNSAISNNADNLIKFIQAVDEANSVILADPIAENIVDIAVEYTGAPSEAVIHGNHLLLFDTKILSDGLFMLADELVNMGDISENPRYNMFADIFRGITW
ncbi:MAG: ABC transporter substrate-binding protein [Oscillospiraceae bacterium]|nr:ABC transporter substrate-binding protein [Oscillospiraceae bacterium]